MVNDQTPRAPQGNQRQQEPDRQGDPKQPPTGGPDQASRQKQPPDPTGRPETDPRQQKQNLDR